MSINAPEVLATLPPKPGRYGTNPAVFLSQALHLFIQGRSSFQNLTFVLPLRIGIRQGGQVIYGIQRECNLNLKLRIHSLFSNLQEKTNSAVRMLIPVKL